MGGLLQSIFGQDYGEYYHLDAQHPETGENLFVGLHADGKGATILSEADIPENVTVESEWSSYVEEAGEKITPQIQDAIGEIMSAYSQLIGENPELTEIVADIDVVSPNYIDVYLVDSAAEKMGRIAAEKSFMSSEPEASGAFSSLADAMYLLREKLNVIVESQEHSALVTTDKDLQELGFEASEIQEIMSVLKNENAPDLTQSPVPEMQQFP